MIVVDANLLLYAYNTSAPQHAAARAWLKSAMQQSEPFALSWFTVLAFLRISTNPRVFPQPLSIEEAIAIINDLLEQPATILLEAGPKHWRTLAELLITTHSHGNVVMDAQLAALALESNAILHSADGDFARFPGLQFVNPLDASSLKSDD